MFIKRHHIVRENLDKLFVPKMATSKLRFPNSDKNSVALNKNKAQDQHQSESTTANVLADNTLVFQEMLNWLRSQPSKNTFVQRKLPSFSGSNEEKPDLFVNLFEEFVQDEAIPADSFVEIFFDCLKDKAILRMEKYRFARLSYKELKELFLEEFDSTEVITDLKSQLFSARQSRDQSPEEFIWQQYALYERLLPGESDFVKAKILRDQLLPEIRRHFLVFTPQTVQELADAARRIANFNQNKNVNTSYSSRIETDGAYSSQIEKEGVTATPVAPVSEGSFQTQRKN